MMQNHANVEFMQAQSVIRDSMAIALRSAVMKYNTLRVQEGTGIVADLVPESE